MGLLVGLPLKLFGLLFAVLRLAWPVLLALAAALLVRRAWRRRRGGNAAAAGEKEPTFNGPVYTVDYEEVDEKED